MNELTIVRMNRYPIKGLSPEPLSTINLRAGEGIPGDRLFGFARYNSGFDPLDPKPLDKNRFVVLLNEAGLAGLQTKFDARTQLLEIKVGRRIHRFEMREPKAQSDAATFLYNTLGLRDPEPPVFVSSYPHRFTDVSVVSPK